MKRFFVACVCVFGIGSSLLCAEPLRRVDVTGLRRIEKTFVINSLPCKIMDDITPEKLEELVLALFDTNVFHDVQVLSWKKGVLKLHVQENALLNRIYFIGNKKVDDDILRKEIGLKSRQSYTMKKVRQAVSRIEAIYRSKGYANISVTPQKITRERGRIDLLFDIDEGHPHYVQEIFFEGNKAFSSKVLRNTLLTCEKRWWRFFTPFDTYDPDRTAYDRELLHRFYLDHGYLDAEVPAVYAEWLPERNCFYLTYKVREGPCYTLAGVSTVSDVPDVAPALLEKEINLEIGDVFRQSDMQRTEKELAIWLLKKGLWGRVTFSVKKNTEKENVCVVFHVKKERPQEVRSVSIKGNISTNDAVIRREALLADGDPVSLMQVQETRRKLYNLNFFKKVDAQLDDFMDDPKLRDVIIEVEDKSTGQLMFSGGYSTAMGFFVEARAAESNFLGKGQEIDINFSLGQKVKNVVFGFTEPYLFGRHLAGGVNLFWQSVWRNVGDRSTNIVNPTQEGFSQLAFGGMGHLSYNIMPDLSDRVRYTLKKESMRNVKVDSVFFQSSRTDVVSSFGHDITYDCRDNVVEPSKGSFVGLSTDWAGLGGSVHYVMNQLRGGFYHAFDRDKRFILRLRGTYGFLWGYQEALAAKDHFFMGGTSVRGFEDAGIGPRDGSTAHKEALGGKQKLFANIELSAPLGSRELGLKTFVFNDWGSLWDFAGAKGPDGYRVQGNDFYMRTSVGLGVRWQSPFGLLGFSLGWPLRYKKGIDKRQVFRFNFGTEF